MNFFLQFGHNMQVDCCELITAWGSGVVVMSPRDCKTDDVGAPVAMQTYASKIRACGGQIIIDPQFYDPTSNHENLTSHGFWPANYESADFWQAGNPDVEQLVAGLIEMNQQVGASIFIVPGTLATAVDAGWLERQAALIQESRRQRGANASLVATVALSADVTKDADQIDAVLEAVDTWGVQGVYLINEHPNKQYLVESKSWIANILDLTAGLRLRGIHAILGYANQQLLAAGCAGASAICVGSHKMKRRFSPDDFKARDDDSVERQSPWYYCPQAFSEFKKVKLDNAFEEAGLLEKMQPDPAWGVTEANILFSGAEPSSVTEYKLKRSYKHYLGCMRAQARAFRKATFDETVRVYKEQLDNAEALLGELQLARCGADDRSFKPVLDFTYKAVQVLERNRGAMLRRRWAALT